MPVENPFKGMKKWQLYTAVGGGGAIAGFLVLRHHSATGSWNPWSAGSQSSQSSSQTGTDPVTGLPYSQDGATDPVTGQQYLAEAQQYGSVAAAEASVSAYGQSTATGSGIPVNPASPVSTGSVNTVVGTSVYTSNAAWAQAVQAGLEDVAGGTTYDGTDIGGALGAYLTQTPLTPAQAQVVSTGIAEYGAAPVGNLQIIMQPASASGPVTANAKPSVSGGHVISATTDHATVGWTGANATKYQVRITGPGKINGQTNTVSVPQAVYTGLESGHNYTVTVTPFNSAGTSGPDGVIAVTTAPATKK
jgi:hypothetical protein